MKAVAKLPVNIPRLLKYKVDKKKKEKIWMIYG